MNYIVFSAIDVGSSCVSMKIYEISKKNGIHKLDNISYRLELGSETYRDGKISYSLANELCEILQKFNTKMKEYGVTEYKAYTGSAIREAVNRNMIIDQIKLKTGLNVEILSNSEQRYMTYEAVASVTENFNKVIQKNTAIVDIGAGSVQISIFDKKTLSFTQNIRIGSLRLREVMSNFEYKTVNFYEILDEYIGNEIDTFKNLYLKDKEIKNVIAVGEEILAIRKIVPELNLKDFITQDQLSYICEKLKKKNAQDLFVEFGITFDVAMRLLPSMTLYKKFLDESKAEIIWTPNITFTDAIVVHYAEENKLKKLEHNFVEDILATANNIAKRYKCNKTHIQNVLDIALKIFDRLKKSYGLCEKSKLLLQIAVILHDCGKYINMNNAGNISYDIILATEIIGLSHREREIIANVVKYNTIDMTDDSINNIDNNFYLDVAKLTAILRVANAMDRSHKQKIDNVTVEIKDNELIITAKTLKDITLERGLFESKADFFEEVYGIRPVLKQKRSV